MTFTQPAEELFPVTVVAVRVAGNFGAARTVYLTADQIADLARKAGLGIDALRPRVRDYDPTNKLGLLDPDDPGVFSVSVDLPTIERGDKFTATVTVAVSAC